MALVRNNYSGILKSLSSLKILLRSGGLGEDELNRLQSHFSRIEELERVWLAGNLDGIDREQTLWERRQPLACCRDGCRSDISAFIIARDGRVLPEVIFRPLPTLLTFC